MRPITSHNTMLTFSWQRSILAEALEIHETGKPINFTGKIVKRWNHRTFDIKTITCTPQRTSESKRERDREGTIVAATLMKGKTTNELPVRKRKKKRRQRGRSVRFTDREINHEFCAQGSDETSCKVHLESGIQ